MWSIPVPRRLLHLRPWRRHSFVLVVAGVVYICYGAALAAVPPSDVRLISFRLAVELMPTRAWGIVWIIVGLLAVASARWPPQSETWGYAAMSGLAAFWSAVIGLGIVFMDTPTQGITGVLVWALMAFMWWAISGLVNPDDIQRPIAFDWSIHGPELKTRRRKE
jgi:hypothetical protein